MLEVVVNRFEEGRSLKRVGGMVNREVDVNKISRGIGNGIDKDERVKVGQCSREREMVPTELFL